MLTIKVVQKNKRQFLQKGRSLWRSQMFLFIDEAFPINIIRPKFLSLLLTGKFRRGAAERVPLKRIFTSGVNSAAVHIIFLPFAYPECTLHLQNLIRAWSYVGTEAVITQDVLFFSYTRAPKRNVLRSLSKRTSKLGFPLYLNKPSNV